MGTVHAKSMYGTGEVGGDTFDMEEPEEKTTIQLGTIRARVDRVHVDGLSRTKDDIIRSSVEDLFHATDFEDVLFRADRVRRSLDALGCFREIGVLIDVSSGPDATPEGLEVTFQVKELSRIVGGVNTTVSQNEGNVVVGVKLPNALGRGEKIDAEYSHGYMNTSNFTIMAVKPLIGKKMSPVLSTSIYKQHQEYKNSGYKLLDKGLLFDIAFKTSSATKHNLQWEGVIRDLSVLDKTTAFKVRESSGPQMKSVLRHIVSVDHRDEPIYPSKGSWVQFLSEVSGLGGSVAYFKSELHAQTNYQILENYVFQLCSSMGLLHEVHGTTLSEHFFLGGGTQVRGFATRGIGPHYDHCATGGKMYCAWGVHLFAPLPFQPAKGGIGELFRSHLFLNGGWIPATEDQKPQLDLSSFAKDVRLSCGLGITLRLGNVARAELNYCIPLRVIGHDRPNAGIQMGIGAHFL